MNINDTVVGVPLGQKRKQTMVVTRIDGEFLVGLLVSRKHPGDFRGGAVMWAEECELAAERADA